MTNEILYNNTFLIKYMEDLYDKLSLLCDVDEYKDHIEEIVLKKLKVEPIVLYNNYTNEIKETTNLKLLNVLFNVTELNRPIISGYGVLYHNHMKKDNIPGKILEHFGTARKEAKHKMFEHMGNSESDRFLYRKYDITQSVMKILANSFFGSMAERSFHFYNNNLGPSITYNGQHIITSAITSFEALLGGNFTFNSIDELLQYILNVKNSITEDFIVMDIEVDSNLLLAYIKSKCDFNITEYENLLESIIENLNPIELQRLYTKNNFEIFIKSELFLEYFKELIDEEFLDPSNPPDKYKELLNELYELLNEIVFYPKSHEYKVEKILNMERKIVLLSDTDSTFINLNDYVQYFKDKFYNGENLNNCQLANIIDIINSILTNYIERVYRELTGNFNVPDSKKKLINMKNEFLIKRLILTRNKKQYAQQIISQEGKIYEKPVLDIKGIQIKKVTTPKRARTFFKSFLDDIMQSDKISPSELYKKYLNFEREIYESLLQRSTEYLTPGKFNSVKAYEFPYRIMAVKGVLLWNTLYPESTIPDFSNINILKLKDPMENIKLLPDYMQEKIINNYFNEETEKYGLAIIAIPKTMDKFPEEFIPLVDYLSIIDSTLKSGNILLELLGFKLIKTDKHSIVSNIMEI
jgi:hypothetical protein